MNKMIIEEINIRSKRIDFNYSLQGEWKKYFKQEEPFIIEYSNSIENTPKSVAVIPFLCNVLPIAWISDAEILLNEIDKDFFESIDKFKQGYIAMYPRINFGGCIRTHNIIENKQTKPNGTAALFSGGVDAFNTLISHIFEKPALITLWGSDVSFEDENGWNIVKNHLEQTAEEYGLEYITIKSSFRRFINEGLLSNNISKDSGDDWWHGFQHGIGLLGHLAPCAYKLGFDKVYIASSFTAQDKGKVTCASDPSIDNNVTYCGCHVIHDGYEYSRQDKIHRICKYVKESGKTIQLRVCWQSKGGTNCCHCEKCYRTILGIIAEKEDPHSYGFNYPDKAFRNMMIDLRRLIPLMERFHFRYKCIQEVFHKNYTIKEVDKNLKWFYSMNTNRSISLLFKMVYRIFRKIKKIVRLCKV